MEEGASMVKRSQNRHQEMPGDCELFRQQIPAFLDRDLSEHEEFLMEQHQQSCSNCRETLERAIPVDCMHVFRHVSDYIDDEVPAELRARMEAHFKECKHCVAVLDGTRNIIQLMGDEQTFDVPARWSERLYRKIPRQSD
jgi:predicted anti-sigma-YlaC factor YlaD